MAKRERWNCCQWRGTPYICNLSKGCLRIWYCRPISSTGLWKMQNLTSPFWHSCRFDALNHRLASRIPPYQTTLCVKAHRMVPSNCCLKSCFDFMETLQVFHFYAMFLLTLALDMFLSFHNLNIGLLLDFYLPHLLHSIANGTRRFQVLDKFRWYYHELHDIHVHCLYLQFSDLH